MSLSATAGVTTRRPLLGAAWGYQFPSEGPLRSVDFTGGDATVARRLRELGFEIEVLEPNAWSELRAGQAYGWDEVGDAFSFRPAYLSVAGGMLPRPDHNAILLVTHPGGAKSFDYEDYWHRHQRPRQRRAHPIPPNSRR